MRRRVDHAPHERPTCRAERDCDLSTIFCGRHALDEILGNETIEQAGCGRGMDFQSIGEAADVLLAFGADQNQRPVLGRCHFGVRRCERSCRDPHQCAGRNHDHLDGLVEVASALILFEVAIVFDMSVV